MKTLLLDRTDWDLVIDLSGNIALASNPYALAQDAASAVKLFNAELWYNTSIGVPYWESILGKPPPVALMKSKFNSAALTVPEVKAARTFITSFIRREIRGQVQVTDVNGNTATAAF